MAVLITAQSGNFLTLATHKVADGTMYQQTLQATSAVSTGAVQESQGFVPGAITIEAITLFVATRVASPTGTFSCWLYNTTDAVTVVGTTTTVNNTDLPRNGPVTFKLAAPVLLLAGKTYRVRVQSTVASQCTLYRANATSTAWDLALQTSTVPGSLVAGDKFIMSGHYTGAGALTSFTITNNDTTGTVWGAVPTLSERSIWVGKGASFPLENAASTNYLMKWKGLFSIADGGSANRGTESSPVPATSTCIWEGNSTAICDSGMDVWQGGNFEEAGQPLTYNDCLLADSRGGICSTSTTTVTRKEGQSFLGMTGTIKINGTNYTISSVTDANTLILTGSAGTLTSVNYVQTAETVLTTNVSTGWKAGDEIAIAPISRTPLTHVDKVTLSVDAVGTTLTLSSPLLWGHLGSGVGQSEIINLTRNVKLRGQSQSLTSFLHCQEGSTVKHTSTEHYWLGSATANRFGIQVEHTSSASSYTRKNCSFHDFILTASFGSALRNTTGLYNVDCQNNVYYQAGYVNHFLSGTTWSNVVFNNERLIGGAANSSYAFYTVGSCSGQITNIRACGGYSNGIYIVVPNGVASNISNLYAKGNTTGITLSTLTGTITNIYSYRHNGHNFVLNGNRKLSITTMQGSGATSGTLSMRDNCECVFNGLTGASDVAYLQPYGIYYGSPNPKTVVNAPILGQTYQNGTADIVSTGTPSDITIYNASFLSSVENTFSTTGFGVKYLSHRQGNVLNANKVVKWEGTVTFDSTIYDANTSSVRLAPSRLTHRLFTDSALCSVQTGTSVPVTVRVRKSTAGNGTNYTGLQPRLMLRANPQAGWSTDQVLDTMSVANGTWETLAASTPVVNENTVVEFYVDCGGDPAIGSVAGWVNVDTFNFNSYDTKSMSVWQDGNAVVMGGGDIPSAAEIAQAVWNAARSGYSTPGSFGESNQDLTATVVDAVWDEPTSGHVAAGSFGKFIQKLLSVAKFLGLK